MPPITEPATLVTDYLLAIFTAVLAWTLRRYAPGTPQRWWALALAATAVAGLAGGTVHGLRLILGPTVTGVLWIVTLEMLVAAAALVAMAALAGGARLRGPAMLAWAVAAAYGLWVANHPRFVFAIAAYGAALALLAVVEVREWQAARSPAARWLLAGVALSVIAAVIQQAGWSPHRHFNHNDLYHVVQAVAIWLLYQGARRKQPPAAVSP